MSLEEYEDFGFRACHVLDSDPVGHWRRIGERLQARAAELGTVRELRIVGEDTDLAVVVEGRTWRPDLRQAARSLRLGSMVRRSWETSLPSISPKPPGSRKSRCMSIRTMAVRSRSISMGSGSASTVLVGMAARYPQAGERTVSSLRFDRNFDLVTRIGR